MWSADDTMHMRIDAETPHSPVVFGLEHVVLQGYELYAAAARDPTILANYGRGTPEGWLERNLYSRSPAKRAMMQLR